MSAKWEKHQMSAKHLPNSIWIEIVGWLGHTIANFFLFRKLSKCHLVLSRELVKFLTVDTRHWEFWAAFANSIRSIRHEEVVGGLLLTTVTNLCTQLEKLFVHICQSRVGEHHICITSTTAKNVIIRCESMRIKTIILDTPQARSLRLVGLPTLKCISSSGICTLKKLKVVGAAHLCFDKFMCTSIEYASFDECPPPSRFLKNQVNINKLKLCWADCSSEQLPTTLTDFTIAYSPIDSCDFSKLIHLRKLNLVRSTIDDISSLRDLPNLEWLRINVCSVGDISCLFDSQSLVYFEAYGTLIPLDQETKLHRIVQANKAAQCYKSVGVVITVTE
jgi:hypothetical protein